MKIRYLNKYLENCKKYSNGVLLLAIIGIIFLVYFIILLFFRRKELIKFKFKLEKIDYFIFLIWIILLIFIIFFFDNTVAFDISNKYPKGILSHYSKLNIELTSIFKFISYLGEPNYVALVISPIFLYAKWKKNKNLENTILATIFIMLIGSIISTVFKVFFMRSRPFQEWNNLGFYLIEDVFENEIPFKGKYMSFPSGHTMVAFCSYCFLAFMSKKNWQKFFLFSLAILIGLSRIYLSAHWASDVIASAGIAIFLAKKYSESLKNDL